MLSRCELRQKSNKCTGNSKEYFFRKTNELLTLVVTCITISSNMHMTQWRDVFNNNRILGSSSKNYRMGSRSNETVMRTTSKAKCRALKESNTIVENILWHLLWNLLMAKQRNNREDVELWHVTKVTTILDECRRHFWEASEFWTQTCSGNVWSSCTISCLKLLIVTVCKHDRSNSLANDKFSAACEQNRNIRMCV